MSDEAIGNVYRANRDAPASANPEMPNPGEADAQFAADANHLLALGVEMLRSVVPSHQSAVAVMVDGDWTTVRKYFSLSPKYAEWADYAVPARGTGLHAWMLGQPGVVRLTESEISAHPAFAGFSGQAGHPPMPGWMARTVRDRRDRVWGLAQLSDRVDGRDYSADDEAPFAAAVDLLSGGLEALWEVRNLRIAAATVALRGT